MDKHPLHLRLKYLFSGTILVGFTLLSVMAYLSYSGDRLATRHSPLVHAAIEIKLNATLGHLWFEEIVAGDRNQSIDTVWKHLELADRYAMAMLEGGQHHGLVFLPLTDAQMRRCAQLSYRCVPP